MKKSFLILLLIFHFNIGANEWDLKSINFTLEDDLFYHTDEFYSYGSRLLFLYEEKNNKKQKDYTSFALVDKIYTPSDLSAIDVIPNDVPYAGYVYGELAYYKPSPSALDTYVFQIGLVGPSAHMHRLQIYMHRLTSSEIPQGWDNQLNNELVLQFNYNKKYYYQFEKKVWNLQSVILPEYGFDAGNASSRIYAGALFRFGKNIIKNYGCSAIDKSTYGQIPLYNTTPTYKSEWNLNVNFGFRANGIARDIFLDGNLNTQSHSVEKKNFTLDVIYGLSLSYKRFLFDWVHTYTTKQYETQSHAHKYTSFQVIYHY